MKAVIWMIVLLILCSGCSDNQGAQGSSNTPSTMSLVPNTQMSLEEAWVRHYGPGTPSGAALATALALDEEGNVYVTGWSTMSFSLPTLYDYTTLKYTNDGTEQWVRLFNGPANRDDRVEALAVGPAGNVYATGESEDATEKTAYATVHYSSTGDERWVARFQGSGLLNDAARAIATDRQGNVYVTGSGASPGFPPMSDYLTIKYDANGREQWRARYNGPGNLLDSARAIAVDAMGNVYVTGESWGGDTTQLDYATIKYNANGEQLWEARYDGGASSVDIATALALDRAGNVYITGTSIGSSTSADYATIKYNSAGVQQWVSRFNGTENMEDQAKGIVVDGTGNVYVTGVTNSHSNMSGGGQRQDYATVKYRSTGEQEWVAIYNGPANNADEAQAIALDSMGHVYVTGQSAGSGTSFDYATVQYTAGGEEQWVARFNSANDQSDGAVAVAVDNAGSVYVTGSTARGGASRITTIKYRQSTQGAGR